MSRPVAAHLRGWQDSVLSGSRSPKRMVSFGVTDDVRQFSILKNALENKANHYFVVSYITLYGHIMAVFFILRSFTQHESWMH